MIIDSDTETETNNNKVTPNENRKTYIGDCEGGGTLLSKPRTAKPVPKRKSIITRTTNNCTGHLYRYYLRKKLGEQTVFTCNHNLNSNRNEGES